jgi:hypothetical protein
MCNRYHYRCAFLLNDMTGSDVVGAVRQDVVTVGRYIEDTVTFEFELHPETMVRAHGSAGAREGNQKTEQLSQNNRFQHKIMQCFISLYLVNCILCDS